MTTLRPYLPADLETLAILLQASVEELAADDYGPEQREAWAASAEDPAFGVRLKEGLTLVALDDEGDVVGFAALVGNSEIRHVHVHPDLAGKGIGRALVEALEKLAAARGAEALTAEATDNARGFFLRLGFNETARNAIGYGEEWLGTTTMTKTLRAPKGASVQ